MGKGKAGRPKKYADADKLGAAIDAYFSSLLKKNGEWRKPPSVAGLCLYLGITRQTLLNYSNGKNKQMAFVAQTARLAIEDYWSGQLAGKFANGAKFALAAGFGWGEAGRWADGEREEREESNTGVIELVRVEEAEDEA